jgi:hypothetical protein
MTKEILEKCQELKKLCETELSDKVVMLKVYINAAGVDINVEHRLPEDLKREGISMRNIKGDFIK